MLEQQRDRKRPVEEYRNFARNLVLVHFALGPVIILLLLLHELFLLAGFVLLWFLISVGLVAGMMRRLEWCRPVVGLLMVLFSGVAAIFITRIIPDMPKPTKPILDRSVLPLWGVVISVVYFALGALLLMSNRVRRATAFGFGLWEK